MKKSIVKLKRSRLQIEFNMSLLHKKMTSSAYLKRVDLQEYQIEFIPLIKVIISSRQNFTKLALMYGRPRTLWVDI